MSKVFDFIGTVTQMGLFKLSQRNLPQMEGKLKLKGLKKTVDITRDIWGIPHIKAKNLHDLSFAQGYVHAQDRLWQMELFRRVATGTLSEIIGEDVVDIDVAARTFGFHRIGLEDQKLLDDKMLGLLKAYVKGVNAFIKNNKLPVEFTVLQYTPKKWTLEDVFAFSKLMSWQLSNMWQGQLFRGKVVEKVGAERANELEIYYRKDNPAILPNGIEVNVEETAAFRVAETPFLKQGQGSNSWTISGHKTTTGMPLLANDPHLTLSSPPIWYENHLKCPGFHVTGVSIPGSPLALIGHNEHISWGVTIGYTDNEDLFIEKFKDGSDRWYEHKGEWKAAVILEESIFVKGKKEPHKAKVIVTQHGPVISEVVGLPNKKMTLQSYAMMPGRVFKGWYQLNVAKNWQDFVHAMSFLSSPPMNIVYADTKGNIGYWLVGTVPVRAKGDGRVPVPGWTGEYEWTGTVPFMEMPHSYNPQKGYIITANNKVVNEDYPHDLGENWMNGYRAKRLEDLIEEKLHISPDDCRLMQADLFCIPGKQMAEHFKELLESEAEAIKDKRYQQALHIFTEWDGHLIAESIAGSIYTLCKNYLSYHLLDKKLNPELVATFKGRGFHPGLSVSNHFFGHDTVVLLRMLDNPDSWWVQEAGGKQALMLKSLKNAVDWLLDNVGEKISDWQWGKLHRAVFGHALSIKKPLDKTFNIGPVPIGGDADTPWQTANPLGEMPNNAMGSASFRQVIDMGDLSKSMAVLPAGQSGRLASPHHHDQLELWRAAKLRPMLWTERQVATYAEEVLVLKPKKK